MVTWGPARPIASFLPWDFVFVKKFGLKFIFKNSIKIFENGLKCNFLFSEHFFPAVRYQLIRPDPLHLFASVERSGMRLRSLPLLFSFLKHLPLKVLRKITRLEQENRLKMFFSSFAFLFLFTVCKFAGM